VRFIPRKPAKHPRLDTRELDERFERTTRGLLIPAARRDPDSKDEKRKQLLDRIATALDRFTGRGATHLMLTQDAKGRDVLRIPGRDDSIRLNQLPTIPNRRDRRATMRATLADARKHTMTFNPATGKVTRTPAPHRQDPDHLLRGPFKGITTRDTARRLNATRKTKP
jgi:hypothetical protein